MVTKGSYALVIDLERRTRLTIGRLGTFDFPAGHYLYMGSALNGLEARVRRHLRQDKPLHWHVDYLAAAASVEQVWYVLGADRRECHWSAVVLEHGGQVVAPGFGSSDCRCATHLLHVNDCNLLVGIRRQLAAEKGQSHLQIFPVNQNEDSRTFTIRESA